jgi:hypothetical protein
MESITLYNLSKMLLKASTRIIENKDKINAINVFPVADSDTGSNLANTFLGVEQILESKIFKSPSNLVDEILKSAFTNSQGNSGIMMASFLKGFLTTLEEKDKFFLNDFAKAAKNGANSARSSIQKPVRGTMLDVMEEFSDSLITKKEHISITDAFKTSAQKAKTTLFNTKRKLKILKENNVVDAGALGFTYFVYGLYEGLSGRSLKLLGIEEKPRFNNQEIGIGEFSHEVIFTVQNPSFKLKQIRDMLNPMGNCLDIIEMEEKVKIHIHTDKPEVVKETASLTGEIEEIKVVDIRYR